MSSIWSVVSGLAPAMVGFGLVQAWLGPWRLVGFVVGCLGMGLWVWR